MDSTEKLENSKIVVLSPETIEPVPRRQDTSFYHRWTFSYFNYLLWRGKKRDLVKEDFSPIEDDDKAEQMADDISREWKSEQARSSNPSLYRVLLKVYGPRYAVAGIFFFLEYLVQLTQGMNCFGVIF
jgi:hypothetical protein